MFIFKDFIDHCRICLKSVKNDPHSVQIAQSRSTYGVTLLEMLMELALELPQEVSDVGYLCKSCCDKLEDLHLFRNQCREIYKFITAVQISNRSSSEVPVAELLENNSSKALRLHLFRLGILSSTDVTAKQFLAEIGFVKKETQHRSEETTESVNESADHKVEKPLSDDSEIYSSENEFGSECSDDKPLASISRKSLPESNKNTTLKSKPFTQSIDICPVNDCQEPLGNQRYAAHLKENHRYGCEQCGLVLSSKHTMVKHVTLHTNLPLTVQCTFCERMFPNVHKMRAHAKDVHLQLANNYECDECDEKFESRKLLGEHREQHLPKNCPECSVKCDHRSKLLYHIKKNHPERLFKCPHCSRNFLKQSILDRHIAGHSENTMDNPENSYSLLTIKRISISSCSQCEKQFTTEAHCLAHMSIHDPAKRPRMIMKKRSKEELQKLEYNYHCDQCDASYRLPTSLESHMKTHTATPFVCDICGAFFKTKTYLKQHVTYRHSKDFRYFCDFCPKACATSSDLQRHRRVHTNERPYKCDQCEARFKTNDGYRKHLRSHTGEKIYRCDLCDRSFMCHSSLKTHKISHTNEKAFKCFYCDQYFNVPKNRRRHILRLHPGLSTNKAPG